MFFNNSEQIGISTSLENGERLADNYQMLEELGSGSFGVVYKAIDKATGEIVAVKHVDLESSEEDLADILSELSVLSSCSSSHVTKYRLAFLRKQTLWIVMEYLGGGSCADLLKPPPHSLSETHIAIICRELLLGLSYLHNEGKLHRDIKAANILLGMDGRVKLADFGVAAQLTGLKSIRNTFVGTPFWMAPEVIQQEGHDAKADVWSLGITAMELANGEPPHANVHPMKVLFLIPKQSAPRLEGGKWSRDFRDFVALCLTKDSDRRPSAKELLKHRFIRSAGKVEGLQELIVRKQEWDAAKGAQKNLKYYAETLKNLTPSVQDDEWVFDTIKASTINVQRYQTQRRKRSERFDIIEDENSATHMMEDLSLNTNQPNRQPDIDYLGHVTSTMRKVSAMVPEVASTDFSSVRNISTKRLSSGQQKPPLGVNMSFGNSPSTMRQFKRVPSNGKSSNDADDENLSGSVIHTPSKMNQMTTPFPSPTPNNNNDMPPPQWKVSTTKEITATSNKPAQPESKETSLGKRLYSRAIGISCQEVLNETGDDKKREAVAKVAEAFSDLEAVDPEGIYHIMSAILTQMKQDPKLQELLPQIPQRTPPVSNASTITNNGGLSTPSTPSSTGVAKLVMAQNNPHLKSHRRRQSAQVSRQNSQLFSPKNDQDDRDFEKEMMKSLVGGLEHTRQLADVLFDRWCEGLRVKWPAV